MDAHKALIKNIFDGGTLIEVPLFQRAYVWKEDLWERLLEDMKFVSQTNKPHFLGSIILKAGRKPKDEDMFTECKTVVDGQQRLTTFIIFLKVLCLKTNQQAYFDSTFKIIEETIALHHGKNDLIPFEKVINTTTAEKMDNSAPSSTIIEAFNYYIENVDPKKLDRKRIVTNTQFVTIDLNENEDEQQIFNSINSLGVNLTTSELLKNYFFNRENVEEYEVNWAAVFEKDDETQKYWNTEFETGRVKRAMIDIFFAAYFQIFVQDKKYNISGEDKVMYGRLDRLSKSYQHFINTYCNGDKNVILGPLKEYALCFQKTFNLEQCERSVPAQFGIERLNVVIFGLKTGTMIPYVLLIAKNVSNEEERNKMYGILESYIMRRMIVHGSSKNYNGLFESLVLNRILDAENLLAKLKEGKDSSTFFPDDRSISEGIKTAKLTNLHSKGILYLMESKVRPANSSVALLGINHYSLEHLMPKKWRNNWPSCETPEEASKRDGILLTLGNLAIITQSLNSTIRDASWKIKKEGTGGGKLGLNLCASGLYTLHGALDKEEWTEKEIKQRGTWLFKQAKKTWPYGDYEK